MSDINSVSLVGRLTKDVEVKGQGESRFFSFALAVNMTRRGQDGNYVDEPNYFDCTWFRKNIDNMRQYLTKGRQVCVMGQLVQRRWSDQNGNQRSSIGVRVQELQLLSAPKGEGEPQKPDIAKYQKNPGSAAQTYNTAGPEDFQEDDIPF